MLLGAVRGPAELGRRDAEAGQPPAARPTNVGYFW
jgi:hypothetical protein